MSAAALFCFVFLQAAQDAQQYQLFPIQMLSDLILKIQTYFIF